MKLIGFFLFFLIIIPSVIAMGGGPSYYRVNYEPGYEGTFKHNVYNQRGGMGTIKLSGDLAPYISGVPETIDLNSMNQIEYTVNLPDEPLDFYGMHYASIRVFEQVDETGEGIVSRTAIHFMFQMDFPFPGIYLDMGVSASNINEEEDITSTVTMISRGNQTIDSGNLAVSIEDLDGNVISTQTVNDIYLETNQKKVITKKFSSKGLQPGKYLTRAVFRNNDLNLNRNTTFRIGTEEINIYNYTKKINKDEISRFNIRVESLWKDTLTDVYGKVEIEGKEYKSPTTKLSNFQSQTLELFIDANGLDIGPHNATLTVYFNGKKKFIPVTIYVVEAPAIEPATEEPTGGWTFTINSTTLLVLLVIILIIFNVYMLTRKKGKNPKK